MQARGFKKLINQSSVAQCRTDGEAPPATHTSWTPRSTPKSTPSCAPTSSILCQKIQVAVYVEFTMLGPLHRDRPDAVRLRMCTCVCAPVRVQAELGLGNSTRHGSVRRTKYATFPTIRSCTCFTSRGVTLCLCTHSAVHETLPHPILLLGGPLTSGTHGSNETS